MKYEPLPRVDAVPLIAATDDALVLLLRGLGADDWERGAVGSWSVRNVAAHLLDGNLRRLSFLRDELAPPPPSEPIDSYADLVGFLNRLNGDWIRATARLSGRVITDWIEATSPQVRAVFAALDPNGQAPFPVDWASGSREETTAWLDVAREYTEKWHHQQQIRDATGRPGLTERRFVEPLLEILVRALPRAYALAMPDADEAAVTLEVSDFPGCSFLLLAERGRFTLFRSPERPPSVRHATIRLSSETTWRLLMKSVSASEARPQAEILGAVELTEPFFASRAVMA